MDTLTHTPNTSAISLDNAAIIVRDDLSILVRVAGTTLELHLSRLVALELGARLIELGLVSTNAANEPLTTSPTMELPPCQTVQ